MVACVCEEVVSSLGGSGAHLNSVEPTSTPPPLRPEQCLINGLITTAEGTEVRHKEQLLGGGTVMERLVLPLEDSQNRLGTASIIRLWFSGAITSYTTELPITTRHTIVPKSGSLLPASPAPLL